MFSSPITHTCLIPQPSLKACLVKYLAYLHYTGINHSSLAALYPTPTVHYPSISKPAAVSLPSAKTAFIVFLAQLFTTLFHPRAIFFLPPFLVHIPAYVFARLSVRLLATPGEEEGEAQFKVIFGGLGKGLGCIGASLGLFKWLEHWRWGTDTLGSRNHNVTGSAQDTFANPAGPPSRIGQLSFGPDKGVASVLKWVLCMVGVTYGTASLLSRWHDALVLGECSPLVYYHDVVADVSHLIS